MKFRNLLVAACSVAVLAGCDSDSTTEPTTRVEGTYTLTTVNNESLPVTLFEVDENNREEIVAGTIVLNSNGTFTDESDLRLTVDGESTDISEDISGTYTLSGNTVTFSPVGGSAYTAVFDEDDGTLTQTVQGHVLVYTR